MVVWSGGGVRSARVVPQQPPIRRILVAGGIAGFCLLHGDSCLPTVSPLPPHCLPTASPPLPLQFPWGFQPPKDFTLPHYTPRRPASTPTPKQMGYTMPGEFEQHAACWMGWPSSGYLWREGAKPAQEQYAGIAKAISQFEPLKMIASPGAVSGWGGWALGGY